jgi:FMN phosphatase YigB (HAD superfamily)
MIKTVFFDIGGVLVNIHPERTVEYIGLKANVPREVVEASFPEEEHHKYELGQIKDQDFFNAVKSNLPITNTLQESDFWTGWEMMIGQETETANILDEIAQSHSVWIVSNTNPHHIRNEASRFTFLHNAHGAVFSFDVNTRKPEPAIYLKALELAGADPEESLFIDDVQANIQQAEKLGFHGIHFITVDSMVKKMQALGLSIA